MREIFFGAAIQGTRDTEQRVERAEINKRIIQTIKGEGFNVVSEHASGNSKKETAILLEKAIGRVPDGVDRSSYIRRGLLGLIDGQISGAIFEVTIPSIGTGIEIAQAYSRPQKGLLTIPILALNQIDYWPQKLSTMIRGIDANEIPNFELAEYQNISELEFIIREFLRSKVTDKK